MGCRESLCLHLLSLSYTFNLEKQKCYHFLLSFGNATKDNNKQKLSIELILYFQDLAQLIDGTEL